MEYVSVSLVQSGFDAADLVVGEPGQIGAFGQDCRSRPLDAPMFCQAALASASAVFAGRVAA